MGRRILKKDKTMKIDPNLYFDKRLITRNLRTGVITREELQKHLDSLEDSEPYGIRGTEATTHAEDEGEDGATDAGEATAETGTSPDAASNPEATSDASQPATQGD